MLNLLALIKTIIIMTGLGQPVPAPPVYANEEPVVEIIDAQQVWNPRAVINCVDLQGYPFTTDIGSFPAWQDFDCVLAERPVD